MYEIGDLEWLLLALPRITVFDRRRNPSERSLKFCANCLVNTISLHTKFSQFTDFKDVFVELVVVHHGKDNLVDSLQLFDVVDGDITQLCVPTATI